jgi:hypothetical protein
MTKEEYEQHIADRKFGGSLNKFREWLAAQDLAVMPCTCGEKACPGWKVDGVELAGEAGE